MATNGQFYWPSVGTFVAAYGQFFMAANIEATHKSNVHLASVTELYETASDALNQQRLLSFPRRLARAYRNYWSISKSDRIELGIRSAWEDGDRGYRGQLVLPALQDVLMSSLTDQFPPYGQYSEYGGAWEIENLRQAIDWLERELSGLEARLSTPEAVARIRQGR